MDYCADGKQLWPLHFAENTSMYCISGNGTIGNCDKSIRSIVTTSVIEIYGITSCNVQELLESTIIYLAEKHVERCILNRAFLGDKFNQP